MNATIEKETLHKFLLKKIKREINKGQAVLHLSSGQEQITEALEPYNHYTKVASLAELDSKISDSKKAFTYVIADTDIADADDFNSFLARVSPMIIRPGLLILVASNLCTWRNQVAMFFGNEFEDFNRPNRAVPPAFLRNKLLEQGFFVKNRFWEYDRKLLIMADIPIKD